jgi:hypothetical protein
MRVATFLYSLLSTATLIIAKDTVLQTRDTATVDHAYSSASAALSELTMAVNRYRTSSTRDTANQQIGIEASATKATEVIRDGTNRVRRSMPVTALEASKVGLRGEVFMADVQNLLNAFTLSRDVIVRSGGRDHARYMLQDLQRESHSLAEAVTAKTPLSGAVGLQFSSRARSMFDRVIKLF